MPPACPLHSLALRDDDSLLWKGSLPSLHSQFKPRPDEQICMEPTVERERGQTWYSPTDTKEFPSFRIEVYTGRVAKKANDYLRWNLLFTALIVVFLSSPFWLPAIPAVNIASMEICLGVCLLLHFLWLIGMVNAVRYSFRLIQYKKRSTDMEGRELSGGIRHLVGICLYKEPLQLMIDTVDSVAMQPRAKEKISCVVGMEVGTPEREEKTRKLKELFSDRFERFFVTVHPKNLPGDIPGKCSNLNYSMRTAVEKLREDKGHQLCSGASPVQLLVTTGDCDSIFGDRYFEALEEDFWKTSEEARRYTVWQSPLFYAINLENSAFVVRVTGLLRSFFMLGYLIPWNINTMSIFSLTLELYEGGEYTHPGYQMEDIIALIRWSLAVRRQCNIRCIPVATLSGPTSGTNYCNEIYEWARQIRRWTIGAAEVFHYFAVKARSLPPATAFAFSFKFLFYYGFLLCIGQLYGIVAPFVTPWMLSVYGREVKGLLVPDQATFTLISLSFIALTYLEMAAVFVVNELCQQTFPAGRRDGTGVGRSLLHWVLSWPTITVYCVVGFEIRTRLLILFVCFVASPRRLLQLSTTMLSLGGWLLAVSLASFLTVANCMLKKKLGGPATGTKSSKAAAGAKSTLAPPPPASKPTAAAAKSAMKPPPPKANDKSAASAVAEDDNGYEKVDDMTPEELKKLL